eukprot:m.166907 g.166907  ORF g.166907 m.166907 type:complete len:277 (-) comp15297_c0_seq1:64-894(-)
MKFKMATPKFYSIFLIFGCLQQLERITPILAIDSEYDELARASTSNSQGDKVFLELGLLLMNKLDTQAKKLDHVYASVATFNAQLSELQDSLNKLQEKIEGVELQESSQKATARDLENKATKMSTEMDSIQISLKELKALLKEQVNTETKKGSTTQKSKHDNNSLWMNILFTGEQWGLLIVIISLVWNSYRQRREPEIESRHQLSPAKLNMRKRSQGSGKSTGSKYTRQSLKNKERSSMADYEDEDLQYLADISSRRRFPHQNRDYKERSRLTANI